MPCHRYNATPISFHIYSSAFLSLPLEASSWKRTVLANLWVTSTASCKNFFHLTLVPTLSPNVNVSVRRRSNAEETWSSNSEAVYHFYNSEAVYHSYLPKRPPSPPPFCQMQKIFQFSETPWIGDITRPRHIWIYWTLITYPQFPDFTHKALTMKKIMPEIPLDH